MASKLRWAGGGVANGKAPRSPTAPALEGREQADIPRYLGTWVPGCLLCLMADAQVALAILSLLKKTRKGR